MIYHKGIDIVLRRNYVTSTVHNIYANEYLKVKQRFALYLKH